MNLLAVPSPSASPAEPNQEVDICWMKSESICCAKSKRSPAESSDKINVIRVKWWIYWMYQAQVPPSWIKCWNQWWIWYLFNEVIDLLAVPSSNASLAESNGEVSNVWMKRWIFWRCHVQAPARRNQAIELMIFSGVMNLLAESSPNGRHVWMMKRILWLYAKSREGQPVQLSWLRLLNQALTALTMPSLKPPIGINWWCVV